MTERPYSFGRDKVYPAPWSGPRGYTTSIPEEVALYKAAIREYRSKEVPKSKPKIQIIRQKPRQRHDFFRKAWTAICDHFKAVGRDIMPPSRPNADVEMPRILRYLCCLGSEKFEVQSASVPQIP